MRGTSLETPLPFAYLACGCLSGQPHIIDDRLRRHARTTPSPSPRPTFPHSDNYQLLIRDTLPVMSQLEWNKHKTTIRRLWLDDKLKLEGPGGVMEKMEIEYSVSATYVKLVPHHPHYLYSYLSVFKHPPIPISAQEVETEKEQDEHGMEGTRPNYSSKRGTGAAK